MARVLEYDLNLLTNYLIKYQSRNTMNYTVIFVILILYSKQ